MPRVTNFHLSGLIEKKDKIFELISGGKYFKWIYLAGMNFGGSEKKHILVGIITGAYFGSL